MLVLLSHTFRSMKRTSLAEEYLKSNNQTLKSGWINTITTNVYFPKTVLMISDGRVNDIVPMKRVDRVDDDHSSGCNDELIIKIFLDYLLMITNLFSPNHVLDMINQNRKHVFRTNCVLLLCIVIISILLTFNILSGPSWMVAAQHAGDTPSSPHNHDEIIRSLERKVKYNLKSEFESAHNNPILFPVFSEKHHSYHANGTVGNQHFILHEIDVLVENH